MLNGNLRIVQSFLKLRYIEPEECYSQGEANCREEVQILRVFVKQRGMLEDG